jgi:hypothetical protein
MTCAERSRSRLAARMAGASASRRGGVISAGSVRLRVGGGCPSTAYRSGGRRVGANPRAAGAAARTVEKPCLPMARPAHTRSPGGFPGIASLRVILLRRTRPVLVGSGRFRHFLRVVYWGQIVAKERRIALDFFRQSGRISHGRNPRCLRWRTNPQIEQ